MKLILFDIDGTLVLIKGAGREAKARTVEDFFGTDAGVRQHPFGGKTDWQVLYEALDSAGLPHSPDDLGAMMTQYQARMAHHLAQIIGAYPVEACPGAHALVSYVRGRPDLVTGLVTGNVASTAPIKLRACGFDPAWFSVGAYGSEALSRNDLPRLALERATVLTGHPFAPDEVIVIGDTVADIECARAVGAVAVAVLTGFEQPEAIRAAQPDYVLPDLTHFLDTVPLE